MNYSKTVLARAVTLAFALGALTACGDSDNDQTPQLDLAPTAFTFSAQTDVPQSSEITSEAITVTGLQDFTVDQNTQVLQVPIHVSSCDTQCAIHINGELAFAYSTERLESAFVTNDDEVVVVVTSSELGETSATATVVIGTESADFQVTTEVDELVDDFVVPAIEKQHFATVVTSAPVALEGLSPSAAVEVSLTDCTSTCSFTLLDSEGTEKTGSTAGMGDQVVVSVLSGEGNEITNSVTLNVANEAGDTKSASFAVTTFDAEMDAIAVDAYELALDSDFIVDVPVTGFTGESTISIPADSGVSYSLDGGEFTTENGVLTEGQTLQLKFATTELPADSYFYEFDTTLTVSYLGYITQAFPLYARTVADPSGPTLTPALRLPAMSATSEDSITLSGSTEFMVADGYTGSVPDLATGDLQINGDDVVISADDLTAGVWHHTVALEDGENTITLTAVAPMDTSRMFVASDEAASIVVKKIAADASYPSGIGTYSELVDVTVDGRGESPTYYIADAEMQVAKVVASSASDLYGADALSATVAGIQINNAVDPEGLKFLFRSDIAQVSASNLEPFDGADVIQPTATTNSYVALGDTSVGQMAINTAGTALYVATDAGLKSVELDYSQTDETMNVPVVEGSSSATVVNATASKAVEAYTAEDGTEYLLVITEAGGLQAVSGGSATEVTQNSASVTTATAIAVDGDAHTAYLVLDGQEIQALDLSTLATFDVTASPLVELTEATLTALVMEGGVDYLVATNSADNTLLAINPLGGESVVLAKAKTGAAAPDPVTLTFEAEETYVETTLDDGKTIKETTKTDLSSDQPVDIIELSRDGDYAALDVNLADVETLQIRGYTSHRDSSTTTMGVQVDGEDAGTILPFSDDTGGTGWFKFYWSPWADLTVPESGDVTQIVVALRSFMNYDKFEVHATFKAPPAGPVATPQSVTLDAESATLSGTGGIKVGTAPAAASDDTPVAGATWPAELAGTKILTNVKNESIVEYDLVATIADANATFTLNMAAPNGAGYVDVVAISGDGTETTVLDDWKPGSTAPGGIWHYYADKTTTLDFTGVTDLVKLKVVIHDSVGYSLMNISSFKVDFVGTM